MQTHSRLEAACPEARATASCFNLSAPLAPPVLLHPPCTLDACASSLKPVRYVPEVVTVISASDEQRNRRVSSFRLVSPFPWLPLS